MPEPAGDHLDRARVEAGLTREELWLRYFALGGMTPALEFEAILVGALLPTPHDHDVVIHAINERLSELGHDRRLRYRSDDDPAAEPSST
ncbi:MAG: hypothetical protein M3N21_02765 [Actinomycetota bacterium]|nr:hypothetical protein [Actinomycetota bacterium]